MAWPWETREASKGGELAYAAWAAEFPQAAEKEQFMEDKTDKAFITARFEGLSQMVGPDLALTMVLKEPIILLWSVDALRGTLDYLKNMEADNQQGMALQIIEKNPRALTVPSNEYDRTKPTIDSLASSSAAIDTLRPLGQLGLAAVIFGSFIVLILILRPIIYGVGGGPSLLSQVLSPITSMMPVMDKRPFEYVQELGISPAAGVALIPLFQIVKAVQSKLSGEKEGEGSALET